MSRRTLAVARGARGDLHKAQRAYTSAADDLHLEIEQLDRATHASANAAITTHNDRLHDLYAAIDAYRVSVAAHLDAIQADNPKPTRRTPGND